MISAVVLAAGRSRRMGAQKLLLPLGDRLVITCVVDAILASTVERTLVVVGTDGDRITAALEGRSVEFVVNPDAEGDMLSSVRCGLRADAGGCADVLVALGDQPTLQTTLIDRMIQAFLTSAKDLVVPVYRGQYGHPLLFAARFRDEILSHYDGVGLRGLLRSHPEAVLELPATSEQVLEDLDTPDDYERQRSKLDPSS
jgi:molybdenum cofactor cytidylyltransferase